MEVIWDIAVRQKIEFLALGIGIIKNVEVSTEPDQLQSIENEVFQDIKASTGIDEIKNSGIVRAYRTFYWKYLNTDPTKIRPSGEALARRVLKDQQIPIINNIVFAINLASIQTQLSFSGFDLDKMKPPLIVRYAEPQEAFIGIGLRHRELSGSELLLSDTEKILCIYAYGDASATTVSLKTRDVLLMNYGAPDISAEILEEGIQRGLYYIQKTGGGDIGAISVSTIAPPEP
jgi:DNA/RNA-binding domain of Phe-tRNA-synthetase-like protein